MSLVQDFPRTDPIVGHLGRAGYKHDPRTLRQEHYTATARQVPAITDHSHLVTNYGMLLNDQLGDCVPVGALHSDEVFMAISKYQVHHYVDPDAALVYERVGAYVPGDPSTDNGCYLIDMLNYWRKPGLPVTGHKLAAFVSVDPTNAVDVKSTIYEFGIAYAGFNLPISAQTQTVWDVPKGGTKGNGAPGSWGGHCVPIAAYDPTHLAIITWGTIVLITWAFLGTYCDELYGVLSYDQMKSGKSNLGFNYTQLFSDLRAL